MVRLGLLSYNIQVGITTQKYAEYVTGSWKHILPSKSRQENLDNIAQVIADFDIVALQEVDAGSLRSGYINQVEYLAEKANFKYWHLQVNRNLGKLAKQSNGLLSKTQPTVIMDHKLPGFLPGRGAIAVQYGDGENALIVVVMHLALSKRSQRRQVSYIADLVSTYKNVILMGDTNCTYRLLHSHPALRSAKLVPVEHDHTYPSFSPARAIDHILVSPAIRFENPRVLNHLCSDHLPVAVDIIIDAPADVFK